MSQVTTSEPSSPPGARVQSDVRVVTGRRAPHQRVRDIWHSRELLLSMIRKELKVKYKNSALGFLWSLLNPAMYLVVFTVVFQVFLANGIPQFGIYLLSGLLVWNLFSVGLSGATGSVTGNGHLINRVSFPREVLPVASVGAALFHFFLQMIVLALALLAFRHNIAWEYMPLLVLALVALLFVTIALSIGLAAINVFARDTQHLLELALLAWFWMTPVVYTFTTTIADKVQDHPWIRVLRLNPILPIVLTFQRTLYAKGCCDNGGNRILVDTGMTWYLWQLLAVLGFGIVALWGALKLFGRLEGRFAEEL
jgi:ABC-2 type transport system permease protein